MKNFEKKLLILTHLLAFFIGFTLGMIFAFNLPDNKKKSESCPVCATIEPQKPCPKVKPQVKRSCPTCPICQPCPAQKPCPVCKDMECGASEFFNGTKCQKLDNKWKKLKKFRIKHESNKE